MTLSWIEFIGYAGTLLTAFSYSMRTIIPLRIAGIGSSVAFIAYGLLINSWPMLATEFIVLPLNCLRLYQIMRLLRQVESSNGDEFDISWLDSFSTPIKVAAGGVLFHEGDSAHELYVIHRGRLQLRDRNIAFGPGDMIGELGFLSPGNRRTATLEATEDSEIGVVTYYNLKQLYFMNPRFGFYLLKLIAGRLFENEQRARREAPDTTG